MTMLAGQPSVDAYTLAADILDPQDHPFAYDVAGWVNAELDEWLTEDQKRIAESVVHNRYTAVKSCHDVGKALALDTPIPTPTGWTTMGELKLGDYVYDEAGNAARVVWTSPVWMDRPCYRVTFDDGAQVTASAEHLWNVLDFRTRHRTRPRTDWRRHWRDTKTLDTEALAAELTYGGHKQRNWSIPTCAPLKGDDPDLPIPPYTLGAWLGDGTSCRYELTLNLNDADEIIAQVEAEGVGVRLRRDLPDSGSCVVRLDGGVETLRGSGLYRDKHIPAAVLRASETYRRAVLAGLVDTDGIETSNSMISIDLCNEKLAAGVAELVRSLGWKTYTGYRAVKVESGALVPCWRLNFTPTEPVARLARKSTWQAGAQVSRRSHRMIVSIEPVDAVPTKCITVDSPSSLFLAGRDMVPTHNSYTAARVAAWWLSVHPPGEAFVVTTAPTFAQVRLILWREIAKAHRKGKLRGRITETPEWKMNMGFGPDEVVAVGRKPADYDQSAFQGIHARWVLVIIDEAGGVPKAIFDAADALVTNENARMLAVGNPDDPASHFATICKPGSGWNVIQIDALRSPNFTREAVAAYPKVRALMIKEGIAPSTETIPEGVRPLLVSVEWVNERIQRWGTTSPLFTSKVRGEFPKVTLDTVIEPGWVVQAQVRELPVDHTDPRMGVDVARYGSDHTIIALRMGGHIRIVQDIPKGPVTDVAGAIKRWGWESGHPQIPIANIDDTGVGGGVTDILVDDGYPVLPLIAGGRCTEVLPNGKPRFVNARSEWWWTMREALAGTSGDGSDGWIDLDPDDEELAAQLLAPKYRINQHGQIEVESKDSMRKRGVDSPDRADAVINTLIRAAKINDYQYQRMLTSDLAGSVLDQDSQW